MVTSFNVLLSRALILERYLFMLLHIAMRVRDLFY